MPLPAPVAATVVIPAYRAGPALRRSVDSVLGQRLDRAFEVVVVVSGDTDAELADADALGTGLGGPVADWAAPAAGRPGLSVLAHRPRLSAAQGRNLGVAHARGEVLVFTDADVVAGEGWLAALVEGTAGGYCAAGAVVNGTPSSRAGTTEYLVEFLDLHPGRPPHTLWHGASANLALPRVLWERLGPFTDASGRPGAVGSADTILTLAAAAEGRLRFVAGAVVTHMNRTRLTAVVRHQFQLGHNTASLARRSPTLPHRRLVARVWAAPLVTGARWVSLWRRVATWRVGLAGRTLALSGHLALALGAWGAGLMVGNCRRRTTVPAVPPGPPGPEAGGR